MAVSSSATSRTRLPVTRGLAPIHACTLLIALLMAAASVLGLLSPARLYPTEELQQSLVANDVINLCLGLPILLGAPALARRGNLLGLLFWPGALFYVLYNGLAYAFALPLNAVFLLSLVVLTLSVYTMAGLVASIDGRAVQELIGDSVPARWSGRILAGLGTLFVVLAFGTLVDGLLGGSGIAQADLAVRIADLIIAPGWILGGISLWRRRPFGYAVGAGLLFQASMLFVGLIGFLLVQPVLTAAPFAMADTVVVFFMGLVCFIPLALFARGILRGT